MSGGVSLAHIVHGPPKTPPLRGGWTRQQPAKWRHHNRRETSENALTSFTSPSLTDFISPFSPRWRTRPVRRHPPHEPPSLVPLPPPLPQFLSISPLRCSVHFDTAEVLAVEADLEGAILTFVNVYNPPASSCPGTTQPTLTPF